MDAEQETVKAYKQIDKLKSQHENEVNTLKQFYAESRLPKDAIHSACTNYDVAKYDVEETHNSPGDQRWKEEFEPFYNEDCELSKLTEPSSWFSGYDRCNI